MICPLSLVSESVDVRRGAAQRLTEDEDLQR
jgi:hypothetical protein